MLNPSGAPGSSGIIHSMIEEESHSDTDIKVDDNIELQPIIATNETDGINPTNDDELLPRIIYGGRTSDELTSESQQKLLLRYKELIYKIYNAALIKSEFDMYQILAFRMVNTPEKNRYLKPFKLLSNVIPQRYADLQIKFFTSFKRTLYQSIIVGILQVFGTTIILANQINGYFASEITREAAKCDLHDWKENWSLKILSFLMTSFISLTIGMWTYKARHNGFYYLIYMFKYNAYPNYVNFIVLHIGLLINFYVFACSIIASYVLIYQAEGGIETTNIILKAVSIFFLIQLDGTIVHPRDYIDIKNYFYNYIKNKKYLIVPDGNNDISTNNNIKILRACNVALGIISWILVCIITICGVIAPFMILICW